MDLDKEYPKYGIPGDLPNGKRNPKYTLLKNSFFFLLIFISFLVLPLLYSGIGKHDLKNRKTIEDIRKLHLQKNVIMLENNGGFVHYLGSNYNWIKINSKKQTFNKFILEKKINMIVDPPALTQQSKLKNDSTWYRFLSNPHYFGFKEKVLDSGRSVFIKEDF